MRRLARKSREEVLREERLYAQLDGKHFAQKLYLKIKYSSSYSLDNFGSYLAFTSHPNASLYFIKGWNDQIREEEKRREEYIAAYTPKYWPMTERVHNEF